MNNNETGEDKFAKLLKEHLLEIPSEQYSKDLAALVVLKYNKSESPGYTAGRWLGKCIVAVLIFFNLLFLYYLNPFSVQPVLTISVAAFVIGFWCLVPLIKKVSTKEYLEIL